jgi:isoaspartyl peptidase/L-asparaginase-like protein (Ntn-hydrolase superfamily)
MPRAQRKGYSAIDADTEARAPENSPHWAVAAGSHPAQDGSTACVAAGADGADVHRPQGASRHLSHRDVRGGRAKRSV